MRCRFQIGTDGSLEQQFRPTRLVEQVQRHLDQKRPIRIDCFDSRVVGDKQSPKVFSRARNRELPEFIHILGYERLDRHDRNASGCRIVGILFCAFQQSTWDEQIGAKPALGVPNTLFVVAGRRGDRYVKHSVSDFEIPGSPELLVCRAIRLVWDVGLRETELKLCTDQVLCNCVGLPRVSHP